MAPSTKLIAEAGQRLGASMTTFGERLYDALISAGMSDAQLASKCGVQEVDVACWLKMQEPEMKGKHLVAAGLALNVSCRWLALGTGSPSPVWMEDLRTANATGE